MKYNKLRFVGAYNVDFYVENADPSGPFVLKGAEGLGPPEVDVSFGEKAEEGGVRQKRRAQNRQIVARVGLAPDWSVGQTPSDLRTLLYGLLTPKFDQMIKAQVMLNNTVLFQAQGDVSNLETAIFSKDPEVQITLDCDYPYFLATSSVSFTPTKVADGSGIIFDVDNAGTAKSGFWTAFTLQSTPTGDLTLSEAGVGGRTMSFAGPWAAGDTFILDTRPGSQGVWKKAAGSSVTKSALNQLRGESPWLTLHGGLNTLRVNLTAFDWYQKAFEYMPAYWGV